MELWQPLLTLLNLVPRVPPGGGKMRDLGNLVARNYRGGLARNTWQFDQTPFDKHCAYAIPLL